MTTDSVRALLQSALVGRYEIDREIGRGGMATVYLARDPRHDRNVALKVLNPELGAVLGAERFLSEIRVTANLQHPNLLPLFDSGEVDGLLYYVMPFVDGETLRARLEREKQLPIEDATRLSVAIASALAYAHEHGVIHRDLKPENILIQAGQPVIADFGIALAVSKAGGARVTQTGLSLGTPQYMSPEQASGDRVIDGRSDIYSLGAVTYEMLAGEPPHSGSSAQAIIAKLMTSEPQPVRTLRKAVPRNVSDAITKSLAKSPADRFTTATEFAAALVNPSFTVATDDDVETPHGKRGSRRVLLAATAAAAIAGAVAGIAIWSSLQRPVSESRPVSRVQVALRDEERIVTPLQGPTFMVSADGSTLVYTGKAESGEWQLWRRRLDELVATPIRGTESAVLPVISPDGQTIAFGSMNDRKVRTVSMDGSSALVVADSLRRGGLHWGSDGFLYFRTTDNGISRVPVRGGLMEAVTTTTVRGAGLGHYWPQLLPGGALLYIDRPTGALSEGKAVVSRRGTPAVTVLATAAFARFASPGYLVWATADRTVFAATFDVKTFALGTPSQVFDGVRVESFLGSADFSFSDDGRLFYLKGDVSHEDLTWVSRAGVTSNLIEIGGMHTSGIGSFALSPDGRRVAVGRRTETGSDIWVKQLPDGPLERLTFEGTPNYWPWWTPDGRTVGFTSGRTTPRSIFMRRSDGTGKDSALSVREDASQGTASSDGKWIALSTGDNRRIIAIARGADTATRVIVSSDRFHAGYPVVSPDGKWIAYVSNESGLSEVYVRPFPDGASGKWQVSVDGGSQPQWSPTGRELFYRTPNRRLMSATYATTPGFAVIRRDVILSDSVAVSLSLSSQFQVSPDGQRFLMARARNQGLSLVMVENWFEELKAKVR